VLLPVGGENASVIALDARDGSTVWKSGSRPASYATLLPIIWRDEPLVIALLQNSLACLHRTTGEVWWEMSLSHGYDEHSASPIYREPHLVVSGPFRGGATLFELQADADSGRCKPVRVVDIRQLSNDVASSVLVDQIVYGFDLLEPQARLRRPSRGEFRAIDFLTGEVRWSSREPGHAQVIAADGKLVLFNDRGEVILARADGKAYRELARTSVFPGETSWTPPALANGRLYLRTHTRAACLYLGAAPLASVHRVPATTQATVKRRSFDPTLLIGSERDYPATTPDKEEFYHWWLWGAVATLVVGGTCQIFSPLRHGKSRPAAHPFALARPAMKEIVACLMLLICGAVGSAVWHRWREDYLFTWPLALWAAFQLTVAWSWSVRGTKLWSAARGRSYLCGLAFFALCGLYFHLCRWLGLAMEWGFLTGLVWSFPLALIASWIARRGEGWARCLWPLLLCSSFSGYYGSTVAFLYYWLRLGD
jgi:outer membrane protein assembly factor BamB